MKKYPVKPVAAILALFAVLGLFCFPPLYAGAYVEPLSYPAGDIARVYIYTDSTITKDLYVPCKVVVTDKEGGGYGTVEDDASTVKIRGNSTSGGSKKPYNFKFSGKTDLFGMGKAKKWCLLANCYEKTLMRNKMALDFAAAIGMDYVAECRYVDVYLNGKFLGNYLLTEAVEIGPYRVDINGQGFDVLFEKEPHEGYSNPICFSTPRYRILLGYNDPKEPSQALQSYVNTFFQDAETALYTKIQSNIERYFDLESFIDDYIVHEYFKNVDFDTSSTRYYLKDGVLHAGPPWDFDLCSGNCSSTFYKPYNNVGGSGNSWESLYCNKQWYAVLLTCPWFNDMLRARFLQVQDLIVNLYEDNLLGENYIDRTVDEFGASFRRNYAAAGWLIDRVYSNLERIPDPTYEENVEYMRMWLKNRNLWMLSYYGLSEKYKPALRSGAAYAYDKMTLKNVDAGTTAAKFAESFSVPVRLYRDGAPVNAGTARTGDCFSGGGPSYQISVKGDLNGDGKLTVTDYITLRLYILGITRLEGVYQTAADFNTDGMIGIFDYINLRLKLLGLL